MTGQEFVIQLVGPYGDLNVLHPCCEGNGRTQRAFLEQLSTGAGYALGRSGMDPQRNEAASDESATHCNVNGRKIGTDFNTYGHGQTKQNYLDLLAHLVERAGRIGERSGSGIGPAAGRLRSHAGLAR
ncbi:hypothetical protein [Streptomyces europaeiscabiei]|uniref:hypothetical protein n=1 Tax=Streptomyces europaeiscabiei TaxID=146819 RepID=UPI0029B77E58|nr:hypothetical protein [Streptomyces europaeiscabiei]MDX3616353.1 hypothetical protein [Streptomyces europaeiscabiei]